MTILRVLFSRLRGLFRKTGLDDEIETHISLAAAEYERRGMAPAQARMAARRQFGGVTQIAETYRERHRPPLVDSVAQDLAYALRQLRKSPIFTAAAILTLALGIGANTAVFRGLDVFMLRSLPVRHAEELVLLEPLDFGKPGTFSFPVFRDLAARQQVATGVIAAGDVWVHKAAVQGRGKIKLEQGRLVTGNYFRVLGVGAALGRVIAESDDRPEAPAVAVISYRVWEREFGSSPDAIGKVLEVNSTPLTVIGVAPRAFGGERVLFTPDLWLPLSQQPRVTDSDWLKAGDFTFLDVMARLRPGVSTARAQAALDPLYRQVLGREAGRDRLHVAPGRHGITIQDIQDKVVEPLRILMWMVGLLLVIACCNLANLLLARGAARTHEIGVRLALGAGRARLVRQLLTESLLLSGLGTALGLALAEWGTRLLLVYITEDDRMWLASGLSLDVLGFVVAVSIAATCLFGVAPALAGTRLDIRSALQANWRTASQGQPRQLLGKAFVVAQVAICLMLLSGAALLARSLWNLERQDWGFRREGVLQADLPLAISMDFGPERKKYFASLRQPLYEKINALPGVRSAAIAAGGPLGNQTYSSEISTPGRTSPAGEEARIIRVSPRYFETMGIPILSGRGITEQDHEKAALVAVLGAMAARRIFDGVDPAGRYISLGPKFEAQGALEVVGVSHDVRLNNAREDLGIVVFVPLEQQIAPFNLVVLRTDGEPTALAGSVRTALQEIAPDLSVGSIDSVANILDEKNAEQQVMAALSAVFGLLALSMASVGLYGVISYAVARRTQEMGIRLALGASREQVTGLVMSEVGRLLAAGIVLGGCASAAGVQLLRSLLFGITLRDSAWPALAGVLLLVVAATAGYLPARRAARLNLLDALRQE